MWLHNDGQLVSVAFEDQKNKQNEKKSIFVEKKKQQQQMGVKQGPESDWSEGLELFLLSASCEAADGQCH